MEQKLDALTQIATLSSPALTASSPTPASVSQAGEPATQALQTAYAKPGGDTDGISGKRRELDKTVDEPKAAAS